MGNRILFVAGPDDIRNLTSLIEGMGLHLVPNQLGQTYSADPMILKGCHISLVPQEQLHVEKRPPFWYSHALDPLLTFDRSCYSPPYLTPGEIRWIDDAPVVAEPVRLPFQKIARWVRKTWSKPKGNSWYYGPDAWRLVYEEGFLVTSNFSLLKQE